MLLLDQSETEWRSATVGAERNIANYTRPVDAPADDQNIELGFSKTVELLSARDGHPPASLENSFGLLQKLVAHGPPWTGSRMRDEKLD